MEQNLDESDLSRRRRAAIEAASRSLTSFLQGDEPARELLGDPSELPPDYFSVIADAYDRGGLAELRLEKRRRLLEIAARDLTSEIDLVEVGERLAALADACLTTGLEHVGASNEIAVISMGKLGGRELNYSSDIDLMFVCAGDPEAATRSASALVAALGEFSPEGQAYRIDLNLRPEGRSGALVRSLDGYVEYYKRWAKAWEYQALIKARHSAGTSQTAADFIAMAEGFVYAQEISEERVLEIRRMKERVESNAAVVARRSKTTEHHDVKLGPGGIRDIEFSVQLLQLVHGGNDAHVRGGNTREALAGLVDHGYVAEEDGAGLEVAYEWLRNVEHRLQLWQERQTHHLPEDQDALGRVARTLGFDDTPAASAAARFEQAHSAVLADVRGRFEKLFYRPMVEALASPGGLSQAGLRERLHVLGFRDVERAARTLEGLVAGSSRRAKLLRVLMPAMLRFLATSPQPDQGLFSALTVAEAIGDRLDVLGRLRDNPPGLALLAEVLGSGRILGEILSQVPEEISTVADPRSLELKDRERLLRESVASLGWRGPERRLEGLRRFKRREMLRVALADIAGVAGVPAVGASLADIADACLEAALGDRPIPFAVIGMGKLGGRELSYSSDIDVMFVFDGDAEIGEPIAEDILKAIGEVTPEGQAFRIDAGLRPEGKAGPLARSLDSYLEYYARWSRPWEHQALIKARAVAGDIDLAERLIEATRDIAFPVRLSPTELAEIRHLKARMEKERIPRGTDPRRNLKMGPGGMTDIEFAAQMLQLRYARHLPFLQVQGTLPTIDGAKVAELLSEADARTLTDAYLFLSRLRNRLFFLHGRPVDALGTKPEELEALGIAMDFSDQPRQELEEMFLKLTRRARLVCETVVFGGEQVKKRS